MEARMNYDDLDVEAVADGVVAAMERGDFREATKH